MLLTVSDFRRRVHQDMDALVVDLQEHTHRRGFEEANAWRASLPKVASLLDASAPADIHVLLPRAENLALEYRLPASSSWADLVLLGRNGEGPTAFVVELKNWQTRGDLPGPEEGLMVRHGLCESHPSDQVRGYVEYCRNFHEQVAAHQARVDGCVVFTADPFCHSYRLAPNTRLANDFPCFAADVGAEAEAFRRYLADRLRQPDTAFAEAFARGRYSQKRSFVTLIGAQIRNARAKPLVLLDHQRKAAALIRARAKAALARVDTRKSVILVLGAPGSGKSAVAARVWADLAEDSAVPQGDLVIVTTSASQSSNWDRLLRTVAGSGASPIAKKATVFTPATTAEFGSLRKRFPDAFKGEADWRANVDMLRSLNGQFRDGSRNDQYLVSLCDEAHALINPEHTSGRGQFGFATAFGPQAWHIIRASRVAVFLLDPRQGFRDRENTTVDDIQLWAREFGAEVERVGLDGHQFRCAGSLGYIEAVEALLAPGNAPRNAASYPEFGDDERHAAESSSGYTVSRTTRIAPFKVVFHEDPISMEEDLRRLWDGGRSSVRLLASYAVPWKTQGVAIPHSLQDEQKDFRIRVTRNGQTRTWAKIWNFVPKGADYDQFIQGTPGSAISEDPLCEVGCPYTVRGFDFDHVGLLWQGDLVWRNGAWRVDPSTVFDTGFSRLTGAAKREWDPDGPCHQRLAEAVIAAYRMLLTRPLSSLHIWCPDPETRARLETAFCDRG